MSRQLEKKEEVEAKCQAKLNQPQEERQQREKLQAQQVAKTSDLTYPY